MREISREKRLQVLKLYFEGHSYDEIAKIAAVSKGSVTSIIRELEEGKHPELENVADFADELRKLAVDLKKAGLTVQEASAGLRMHEKLKSIGVSPQTVEEYVKMCKKISQPNFPVGNLVSAAMKLYRLEKKLGKGWDEALKCLKKELRMKSSKLAQLNSQVDAMSKEKTRLQGELAEVEAKLKEAKAKLNELMKGVESLGKLGVEKVCKLSKFVDECEKLGYSAGKLKDIMKLVEEKDSLEKQSSALKEELKAINQEIEQAKEERFKMIVENRHLEALDMILKAGATDVSCSRCGGPLTVPIPPVWKLEDAMMRGLIYPVRCHRCGFLNQIGPRDILASIAWSVLTT